MIDLVYLLGILLFVYAVSKYKHFLWNKKVLIRIRENWGKIPDKQFDLRIAKDFFKIRSEKFNKDFIDDETWDDLDLNEMFEITNRGITPIGAQYLYFLLRHPVSKLTILKQRETLINEFSKNQKLREKIILKLMNLRDKNVRYLAYSLWKPLPDKPKLSFLLTLLSLNAIVILLLVGMKLISVIYLSVPFVFHMFIRWRVKRKINEFIVSFQFLGVLIRTAEEISLIKMSEIQDIQKTLKEHLSGTKLIADKIFALQFKDEFGLFEYINIYFLFDVSGFYSALNKIRSNIEKLRGLFETIGHLDAMLSVASFREEFGNYCCPEFQNKSDLFYVKNIYHPLLKTPVPNSFQFESKSTLITGSNMSGKTTFLKTMGVNVVLAQTIFTCLAERYQAPFIRVVSSIGRSDNLLTGKSYYLAEVESILKIIKAADCKEIHLFLIDEIFRGTNSVERHAVSIEVLNYLANNKDFVMAATHDLQLTEVMNKNYNNFHFREVMNEDGLGFDYCIHSGPTTSKNAIALLDFVGYPKQIVNSAKKRVKNNLA
ncbi:hypothetical protein B6I21_03260 [candidate division KSB1 bacterium 4572_119]|nr:MAG: hypothetical protein B6I21_03260 [candidate division KSB1 bacterium 4572_119]